MENENIIETSKELIFYDITGKRFLERDVASISIIPKAGYYDDYHISLTGGEKMLTDEQTIMKAHENPQFIFVPTI